MFRKYLLPFLSVSGFLFAVWMVLHAAKPVPPSKPVAEPPRPPYAYKISGSGIVEASTRNIAIGTPISGVVAKVFVKVSQRVKAGDSLFVLDDRKERAALAVQGPTTWSILNNMGLKGLEELKMFDLRHFEFEGTEMMVSRTGFTGDLGYELWIDPAKAEALWDALFDAGKDYAMRAIGVHALEQARIEAGLLAAYQDSIAAAVSPPETSKKEYLRKLSPYQVRRWWTLF